MSLDLVLIPGTTYPDATAVTRAELRKGAKPTVSLVGLLSTDQIASCAVTAAKVKTGAYWYGTATVPVSVNAIVLTTTCPLAALTAGAVVAFKAAATNTGAVTIDVDSLGPVALKKYGTTALGAGDILIGAIYEIRYDGTAWQVISPVSTALDTNGGSTATSTATGGGLFAYAMVRDEKAAGTNAGTVASGSWVQRDLNTEVFDAGAIVTVAANQITVIAGTYLFRAVAGAQQVDVHRIRLQNITAGSTVVQGQNVFANNAANQVTFAEASGRFVIAAATVFQVQQRVQTTRAIDDALGTAHNITSNEIYTTIELWKIG